jgi:hypothetical protein
MKKTMKNYGILVAALMLTFSFASAAPAAAKGGNENPSTELKFIGSDNNHALFQLSLINKVEDEYSIIITDVYGNILYSDNVKGSSINKKFSVNLDELGVDKLFFKVRARKSDIAETYEINRSVRFVEEANISKIK